MIDKAIEKKRRIQRLIQMLPILKWVALIAIIMFIIIIVVGYFIKLDSGSDEYSDFYEDGTDWWWPIGSLETTNEGGKLFASGDPASVAVTSKWGYEERRKIT